MTHRLAIPKTGAVVMASGKGLRFRAQMTDTNDNKLLADFCGRPMISTALHIAASPLISARIAVTRTPGIRTLCTELDFPCLLHDQPYLSDTIRLGLQSLLSTGLPELPADTMRGTDTVSAHSANGCLLPANSIDGCLFLQGDQPLLSRGSVEAMILAFRQDPQKIYRLSWEGRPGSPVLFPKHLFSELLNLPQDCGGNIVIRRHPDLVCLIEAASAHELLDADTPEELKHLQSLCHNPF